MLLNAFFVAPSIEAYRKKTSFRSDSNALKLPKSLNLYSYPKKLSLVGILLFLGALKCLVSLLRF